MQYHARGQRAGFLAVEGRDNEEGEGGGGHGSGAQDSALYGAYTLVSRISIALYYL